MDTEIFKCEHPHDYAINMANIYERPWSLWPYRYTYFEGNLPKSKLQTCEYSHPFGRIAYWYDECLAAIELGHADDARDAAKTLIRLMKSDLSSANYMVAIELGNLTNQDLPRVPDLDEIPAPAQVVEYLRTGMVTDRPICATENQTSQNDIQPRTETAGTGIASPSSYEMQVFRDKLMAYAIAALELTQAWENVEGSNGDSVPIDGYPSYLPSFDEHVHDLFDWSEALEKLAEG